MRDEAEASTQNACSVSTTRQSLKPASAIEFCDALALLPGIGGERHRYLAVVPENARHLPQPSQFVRPQLHGIDRQCLVEVAIDERHVISRTPAQLDPTVADRRCIAPRRLAQHLRGGVDAGDVRGPGRQHLDRHAGTKADLQHAGPAAARPADRRPMLRNGDWCARGSCHPAARARRSGGRMFASGCRCRCPSRM